LAVTVLVLGVATATTQGQERQLNWRTVKGTVVDKKGKPTASALVYLKDSRGRRLKIKPADRDGHFDFKWLDLSVDYEIHAESVDSVSDKLIISSSDRRPEIVVKLRLDKNAVG